MPVGIYRRSGAFTTSNSSYGFGQIMARAFYYTQTAFTGLNNADQ